jgi:hypothetical protein
MRSIKDLYGSISKDDLIIGEYYGITTNCCGDIEEWIFRFNGFSGALIEQGGIMSDITYVKEFDGYHSINYGSSSVLCDDNEIVDGSIRKYSQKELNKKLNP